MPRSQIVRRTTVYLPTFETSGAGHAYMLCPHCGSILSPTGQAGVVELRPGKTKRTISVQCFNDECTTNNTRDADEPSPALSVVIYNEINVTIESEVWR